MSHVVLLTEDAPSEAIAMKLLASITDEVTFDPRIGGRGIGYVSSKLKELNRAARGLKILAIVDRDSAAKCPIELTNQWIGGPREPTLLVRFAEMEIESWIMADRAAIAEELMIAPNRVPDAPDTLLNAKEALVNLARTSRSSEIRADMCPAPKATAQVGPAYNDRLISFIERKWNAQHAINTSPSLRRAHGRLVELIGA